MTNHKPFTDPTSIKKVLTAFPVRTVLVLLISFLSLPFLLSSCGGSGCGGPWSPESYRYTSIHLIDSTNHFLEIKYPDINDHHQLDDSYLDSSDFHWNLRISKPQTTMLIRTAKNGWDTLVYSMEKKNIMYTEATECDEEGIRMEIIGPNIVSHSFDTAYIKDVTYTSPYSSYSTESRILYIK